MVAWAAFLGFAATVLALRFWILPDIARYRAQIVAGVARTVGQPVSIGGIEAGWLGLRPQIFLSDVRIYDAQGREALVLPSIENVISWRSLLYRDLRLHSLVIDGPRLSVRRDGAGALYVAGMKLTGGESNPRITDWLLGQREIEIRNAEIEWTDEKRAAPRLRLEALNFRLRSGSGEHFLGISARPPASLGSSVELRARLTGRSVTALDAWSGRVFSELGYTDLAAWRAWVDYPLDVQRGHGALRIWATLERGELRAVTADVALADFSANLGQNLAPLELAAVQGRLQGRISGERYELSGWGLALTSPLGPKLQPTDFQLRWQRGAKGNGALATRLLELEPLARLSGSLPVPDELRKLIAELEPRGHLADARIEWQGAIAAPSRIKARARFNGLGMRSWRGVPGFSGLSGSVEASESRGRISLHSSATLVDLPQVFPEPRIVLDSLNGSLDWEREGDRGYEIRLSTIDFANSHFSGQASGRWTSTGSGAGKVDLSVKLTRADGSHTARYLPHGSIMGEETRKWLASAIVAGQASDVQMKLRGELKDFPFHDPHSGHFSVSARVQHGELDYGQGWPRVRNIDGELLFERDRMAITGRSGNILGARLSGVKASIASMQSRQPILVITGQAEGPTRDFLEFVESSPVRRMTDGMADQIAASGRGRLRLKMEIPLGATARTKVAGGYDFSNNRITLHPQLPALEQATGRVSFSDAGFAVHNVTGSAIGGPVSITGGTQPGAGIEVIARGEASVAELVEQSGHPWRRYLSGASAYTATVSVKDGLARIGFESSLRGVASTLPPPLDKASADALPLRVDVLPGEGGARDRISVTLGKLASAEILRQQQGAAMQVQRAAIWLSPVLDQAVRVPERPGTLVYGSLPSLDLDRWLTVFAGQGRAADAMSFELAVDVLDAYGKRLNNVFVKAGADAAGWSATIKAEELAGDLSYRVEKGGQLVARLAHFSMPEDSPGPRPLVSNQPKELPGIDLVSERFSIRGKQLGRIEVAAQRAGEDWRIDKLTLVNPDSTLRGTGAWTGGTPSRSSLQFELETSDAGKSLARIGYSDLVSGGKAKMRGTVAWQGEPTTIDYPSLSGKLKMDAEDGQFLEIEPGIGRLVSLMSLQALPKHISLDFRDVFSKGFRFDRIRAGAQVDRGVMTVDEFKMRGSAAEVEMSGLTDLARETQNLKVRVIPSLGDSASTVVGILNPIAGLAAAIAQRLLKNPLGQIFAYDYAITGTWGDPKVTKLEVVLPPESEIKER